MSLWWLPLALVPAAFVARAWQQDRAIRSGELMDVRDVMPSGEADLELRAVAERSYRLELQFEAVVPVSAMPRRRSAKAIGNTGILPVDLRVLRSDDGETLHARSRPLSELFAAAHSSPPVAGDSEGACVEVWGSVPLLEFETRSLGRLRFELSLDLGREAPETGGAWPGGRIRKAQLVLKEDVRRLRFFPVPVDWIEVDAARPGTHGH